MTKVDHLASILPPSVRLSLGIISIILFITNASLLLKGGLILIYALLCNYSGKKLKFLYFFITIVAITFFHLIHPLGVILLQMGPFTITKGALIIGLNKALSLVGLIFISLFSVHSQLALPGKFGRLISSMFYYFEQFNEYKGKIKRKSFFEDLDRLLQSVHDSGSKKTSSVKIKKYSMKKTLLVFVLLFSIAMAFWLWAYFRNPDIYIWNFIH